MIAVGSIIPLVLIILDLMMEYWIHPGWTPKVDIVAVVGIQISRMIENIEPI